MSPQVSKYRYLKGLSAKLKFSEAFFKHRTLKFKWATGYGTPEMIQLLLNCGHYMPHRTPYTGNVPQSV